MTSTDHGGRASVSWASAARATGHCLTGCALGEVVGMIVGTAFGLGNAATVVLSVVLAFVFGYTLTTRGVLRAGVDMQTALRVALAADTVSIAVMELVDNAVVVAILVAMDAGLGSMVFWASLAVSLVIAFAAHAGQPVVDQPRPGTRGHPRLPLIVAPGRTSAGRRVTRPWATRRAGY